MILRLLDTLLPAIVLVAVLMTMATAFGALSERPQPRAEVPVKATGVSAGASTAAPA